MRLLFIQGGTRLKKDNDGNWYTDGNFNDSVWKRYTSVCDSLTVLLRTEETIYKKEDAITKFNKLDDSSIRVVALKDIYKPPYRYLNLKMRRQIYNTIEREIRNSDRVIIRSIITYYTICAYSICRKLNKPYLIEVTGVAWDANWYHSLRGKIAAPFIEIGMKNRIKNSPFALYVTQEELQKRYPCSGKTVGCSNVELDSIDPDALLRRISKINNIDDKIIIGTIGGYSLKTKGQMLVIKAMGYLKRNGITNVEYQMIGGGDNSHLIKEARKQGVVDRIRFLGTFPHDKVFEWLDNIDIYIQPSYQEGLCRSVVEAMSRACPVICSDACGERELADIKFIFKRGDWKRLSNLIVKMNHSSTMKRQAERSYNVSHNYNKDILDERRRRFYLDYIDSYN